MGDPCFFQIRFSQIVVRFVLPTPIVLPDNFEALQCEDSAVPDDIYTVQLLTRPLCPDVPMIHAEGSARIYHTKEGWLHIYPVLGDAEGCQVACLFCPDGNHTIYYPASRWEEYSRIWRCTHLICGERLLLRHDALLLHSSCVMIHGKAVLFSGPSGAGKSTQAKLWHQHLGADIINGDRTVVMRRCDGFWGGGSMWSGTSGIFRQGSAPIAGIFLVEKAPQERVERLGFQAFVPLFSQTIVNSWDRDFMAPMTDLFADLLDQVPIYRLYCRPGREAVELAHDTLFAKEDAL